MREPCYKCKFEHKPIDQEPCDHCSDVYIKTGDHPAFQYAKPITNYDRLISKTAEELADWLCKILTYCSNRHCDPDCPLFKCCHDQPTDNIEGWLKSPAEKEADE